MGTSMEDGETFCACGVCLPGVMLGMTAATVAGMPADEAQSHADAFKAILAVYDPPPASKPRAKRSRSSSAKPPGPDEPAGGPMPGDQPLLAECPQCEAMVDITEPGIVVCDNCQHPFDPSPSDV